MESYIEVQIEAPEDQHEIIIAELCLLGYDSFWEEPGCLKAYIKSVDFEEQPLNNLNLRYQAAPLLPQNWNAIWESGYNSIEINDYVQIVPEHRDPKLGFEHTLIIQPQMSFGTGHHETTRLMLRLMKELDFKGKRVLDMGCGTGILGIMAGMLGATDIYFVDIEAIAIENCIYNLSLNYHTAETHVFVADASKLKPLPNFQVILANIQRNVLAEDMYLYVSKLEQGGKLLISGFFEEDQDYLIKRGQSVGLTFETALTDNNWVAIQFSY